jgi:hypothetical protein
MNGPLQQLPLYETCDVCGRVLFGFTTGLHNPPHKACGEALNRWIRDDNFMMPMYGEA